MLSTKNKKIIIVISAIMAVVLLGIVVTVSVLFTRLKGSNYINIWFNGIEYDIENHSVIVEKQEGKDFVILQLTDMQLWTNGKDNEAAFVVAEKAIKQAAPNLVVFTGDNVSGVGVPELLKTFIKNVESLAKKYNFLWAPIFGNHDNEMRATPNWSADQYLKASVDNGGHCLFQKGPTNLGDEYGDLLGNYVINVKQGDKIIQSLYMLDNSSYADYENSLLESIYQKEGRKNSERPFPYAQIAWCEWQAENINKLAGYTVPSIFFTHCAPYEMGNTLLKFVAGEDGRLGTTDDLKKQDNEGYWTLQVANDNNNGESIIKPANSRSEDIIYPLVDGKQLKGITGRFAYVPGHALYNTGIVDKMKKVGLKGWFVGHDHENDIIFEYDDVIYGYGLKAGPSPKPWNDSYYFGGTSIVMDIEGNITANHIQILKASDYWQNKKLLEKS